MLKRHSQFLQSVLFLFDLTVICACWIASYHLRFLEGLAPVDKGVPPLDIYLSLLLPIVFVWGLSFRAFNLYRPRRMGSHVAEFFDIAKANTLSVLVLVALTFFVRQFEYSRLVFFYFWILNLVTLGFSRMAFREGLRFIRKQGFNQRHCLIVGAGKLGQRVARLIAIHSEFGIKVQGYLTRHPNKLGRTYEGITVTGLYSEIEKYAPALDIVFLCLPPDEEQGAEKMLQFLATTTIEVKVIPSIYEFITLRAEAEMFEGLPVITLQGSPLYGWNVVLKSITDFVGAAVALTLTAPLMVVIALAVKLTSPGPVFYRQERMGIDGKPFMMLKFRTMHIHQPGDTVLLTPKDDPRITTVGRVLRKTSLDELPQFLNVMKGEMSIVGPRPERSWVVEEVRKQIPLYMLKHKMKAGITGWAQVNGWRGDTSLDKRIEYDLYYIEHWSVWFDVKIALLTIWRGFVHKHAY
ncbi:MAG TPA: undecaprenyl-phosphate glucose phosphotransferase [Anaerolineales bacterium]|nr:undecaprenyl-phosphate glucose phosphotransferase [Nitrospira sp.]HET6821074.1 undecaprenyl-phosphate glucose phosphotransferase [Anaerolineales bacterium]